MQCDHVRSTQPGMRFQALVYFGHFKMWSGPVSLCTELGCRGMWAPWGGGIEPLAGIVGCETERIGGQLETFGLGALRAKYG